MGKHSLHEALQSRDGSQIAVVPRIQRHAAAIEQIPDLAVWTDPEAIARALRNVQSLYSLDAVTLGDTYNVAVACRQASSPGLGPLEALTQSKDGTPLFELPSPESVITTPVLSVYLEACRRIQTVLGDRAGIAILLPDHQALRDQLASQDQSDWAQEVLIHIIRAFGPLEPDLFMFFGAASQISTRLRPTANHFGAAIVHVSTAHTDTGVWCLSNATSEGSLTSPVDDTQQPWLITTLEEVEVGINPSELGKLLLYAREQKGQKE